MKDIIKNIPTDPGIYLMKDEFQNIIYVGKAKNLKKRVSQYFNTSNKGIRIEKMIKKIANIEYIITKNELEALVLECNYIKEYMPKYNVLLKDDKTYPYIKINIEDKFPEIIITRVKKDDKSLYFGPYTDVHALKETMRIIKEVFPVKRCKYNFNKTTNKNIGPCLYYHIGRCLGPCINQEIEEEYKNMLKEVILFLRRKY